MTYPGLNSRSAAPFQRSRAVMPGGNRRHTVYFAPYPIYTASGQGCTITDVDGIKYTDFISNASAAIHGHNHPAIVDAARTQLERLVSVGLPTESEIILAEAIVARLPSIEQLRFCNSGSEAVMFALKTARAFTGKPKIAKIEGAYHGGYDTAETSLSSTPENWGASNSPVATPSSIGCFDPYLTRVRHACKFVHYMPDRPRVSSRSGTMLEIHRPAEHSQSHLRSV